MQSKVSQVTEVNFAAPGISARHVSHFEHFAIGDDSIVVNLGPDSIPLQPEPQKNLAPAQSALLRQTCLLRGSAALIIEVKETRNSGTIILQPGWQHVAAIFGDSLKNIALWRSPQIDVGTAYLDPLWLTGQSSAPTEPLPFHIKVNLWFAPERTDCAIHNQHAFIEFHTQVLGTGRMQKFHRQTLDSQYQDILMSPGQTHQIFCQVTQQGKFDYPWHQYYSDSDAVWMATELHPAYGLP